MHKSKAQFELFKGLGLAETLATVEKKIDHLSREIYDHLETETLFKATSETEDIKLYLKEVLTEMKESKMNRGKSRSDDFSDSRH